MTRSTIRACVADVVGEVAEANGASVPSSGSVRPATDLAGVTSAQLLFSTSELAYRLGLPIPTSENVFVRGRRGATLDEVAERLFEIAQLPSTNGTASPSLLPNA
ncbi:hypothetical protein [Rubrivirga litoralis]|uniref:Uncharacterized protein n=1 Tax=Rubrivirga litoralis TaxID=3075598 RepID=A0ABU3BRP1_9BACT|nr:hypothetical protein [Rubrivirga sp. F394]MDT0631960.1 hypothetical protein [Rubrivirga sp. F394]